MKKFFGKIAAAILSLTLILALAACAPGVNDPADNGGNGNNDGTTPAQTVHVYMPDGAPAVALASFMDSGYANTEFTVVAATTIAQRVTSGAADLAVLPVNAAATLYNGGKDIVMLTVNTHGNLFIVGDGENVTLSDLAGKRVGIIGEGNVPDQVFRMLLGKANIAFEKSTAAVAGKVAVQYADEGAVLLPMLKQGRIDYAVLAEPAATTAVKNLGKKVVADIQQIWSSQFDFSYPQACLVAQGAFVRENAAYVDKFVSDLKATDGWAEANPDKALEAVKSHAESGTQSTLAMLNASIVANCNIRTAYAAEMRGACDKYFTLLTTLAKSNEDSSPVLAKIPDNNFYYKAQ